MSCDREPSSCLIAIDMALSVFARIRSMTASACVKSIRPFKKARFVNSPGSAIRAPCLMRSCKMSFVTAIPPWELISITSSLERSEEHTSELQSRQYLECRLLLEKKKYNYKYNKHQY